MTKRSTVILILAVALMFAVMGTAAALHFGASAPRAKWTLSSLVSRPVVDAEAMKVIDLTGDGVDDIMVQGNTQVSVLDENLNVLYEKNYLDVTTTMGDFDGDEVDDLAVIYDNTGEDGIVAEALSLAGAVRALWRVPVVGLREPARAASADLDGDRVREVIVGDIAGNVVCLNSDGSVRWTYQLPVPAQTTSAYVRGLDDVATPDGARIIAANYAGSMVMLDGAGKPMWSAVFPMNIRRVRSYDLNGDGTSEVIVGGETGRLECFDGATGMLLWGKDLGNRVVEIRAAELDDNPAGMDILVGMRDAGVIYGFDAPGNQVARNAMSGRVIEFAPLDIDEDGRDEFIAGSEEGTARLFKANEPSLATMDAPGLTRLDVGGYGRSRRFVMTWGPNVGVLQIGQELAPVWYSPLTAGLVACLVIAALAFAIASLRPKPKLQYSADDMSIEGLRAKRKMLLESVADLSRSFDSGEVPAEAFEARSRELREQVAAAEAELLRLGARFDPSVMKCPNCGGPVDLGKDHCPYCGTTLL